jgi:hypothetical protein
MSESSKTVSQMSNAELFAMGQNKPADVGIEKSEPTIVEPGGQTSQEPIKEEPIEEPKVKSDKPSGILGGRFKDEAHLEQELNTLNSKIKEYESKLNELKDKEIPDIDEDFIRLDALKKKAPDKWAGIAELMWGTADNMQILIKDLMQSRDYFSDKPELAKEEIMARYEPAFMELDEDDEDYEVLKKQKERAIRNMEADALDVKKRIMAEFKKIEVPKVEKKTQLSQEEIVKQRVEQWKPVFDKFSKSETLKQIPVIDGFNYVLTDEARTKVIENAANLVVSGMIPFEEGKSLETLTNIALNQYFLENKENIMKAYAEYVRGLKDDEWLAFVGNSSALAGKDKKVKDNPSPADKNAQNQEYIKKKYSY